MKFGGNEVVAVRDVNVVGEGPLARIIDQFAVGIVDDEGANVGDAARFVAQFQMNIVAAELAVESFADARRARNFFAEFLLQGLHRRKSLFDLLCDDERGIRQRPLVFGNNPIAQIVNNQTGAAHGDDRERDGADDDESSRAKKFRRR